MERNIHQFTSILHWAGRCWLQEFIMNQDWNDAKSQLQQCCLTLRDTSLTEPDIPVYKYVCALCFCSFLCFTGQAGL